MKPFLTKHAAWLTDQALCLFVSFITGIRPKPSRSLPFTPAKKVYYANHSSHGDFVLVWISLPRLWRMCVRPVAGADYWLGNKIKRFIIKNVFNALLIERDGSEPQQVVARMTEALQNGGSLILFPEGTRNTDDETVLLPFKSGIYHLACENPDVSFIPMWINNINRVLPKGKILPVPLLCDVHIGEEIRLTGNESKEAFLLRARRALLTLAPPEQQQKAARQEDGV